MTRRDLMVVGTLTAAVLALTASVWARPGGTFFNHGDLYAYHWPLRHHTAAALIEGRLPFWNPYIMLGVPHAANPQAALFYPASVLGFLLPVMTALVWDQLLHLLWAGLGAFLLARAARLPRAASAALAAAYALSPFLIYRVTAGIPTLLAALSWAPWAWLAWLYGSAALLAAVFALQFFSGHPQFLVINAAGMGLWAATRPERLPLWKRLAAGAGGALALAAVQWLPTLELLRGSNRSAWPAIFRAAYSLRPRDLLMWLSPGAFGTPLDGLWDDPVSVFYESGGVWLGVIALSLVVVGLARGRARTGAVLLAVLGTVLALGANGPLAPLLNAPGFSYLRTPSRWSFLTVWGLWLLAGAGARELFAAPKAAKALSLLPLVVFAELALWDSAFVRSADARPFTKASSEVVARLAGRGSRMITDPALANPNKAIVYRMRNANGYDAFYPGSAALWAAEAEGAPAADPSWVLVSRWKSEGPSGATGSTDPFISGQSGKMSPASSAVTLDPNSRRAKVAAAPNAARSVKRWLPLPPRRAGYEARTSRYTRRPTSAIAAARCAVTDSPELPSRTVSRPSHAWNPTSSTAAIDGHRMERRSRWSRIASAAMPRMRMPISAATERWIHSAQTWNPASRPGRNWPSKQPGQCGQAMPESVARTTTPMTTSTNVVMTVAAASRWNRVTDPPGGARGF